MARAKWRLKGGSIEREKLICKSALYWLVCYPDLIKSPMDCHTSTYSLCKGFQFRTTIRTDNSERSIRFTINTVFCRAPRVWFANKLPLCVKNAADSCFQYHVLTTHIHTCSDIHSYDVFVSAYDSVFISLNATCLD